MKDKVYLVCTPQGVTKMVRPPLGKPKPGEVIVEVRVGVDPRMFFPTVPPVDLQINAPADTQFEVSIGKPETSGTSGTSKMHLPKI